MATNEAMIRCASVAVKHDGCPSSARTMAGSRHGFFAHILSKPLPRTESSWLHSKDYDRVSCQLAGPARITAKSCQEKAGMARQKNRKAAALSENPGQQAGRGKRSTCAGHIEALWDADGRSRTFEASRYAPASNATEGKAAGEEDSGGRWFESA